MSKPYLAICAIFRDEARYLAEWISFHRLVGVEHFFLYDNGSIDEVEIVLEPFIAEGCVTLCSWPIPFHLHAARRAYADCLEKVRGQVRWLACIDLDEFLFSPENEKLTAVLTDFETFPGVVVRWQVYGSSGNERMSDEPVISRFTRRAVTSWIRNRRVKSIVDPERALKPLGCHHFEYFNGALAVDECKHPVTVRPGLKFKKRLKPFYRLLGPVLTFIDPYARRDISKKTVSVDRLRINHYPVKSREEFLHKARYKKEKRRYEGVDYFTYHDRNDVYDPVLLPYADTL